MACLVDPESELKTKEEILRSPRRELATNEETGSKKRQVSFKNTFADNENVLPSPQEHNAEFHEKLKSEFDANHRVRRRFFPESMKLLKVKWQSMEEKPRNRQLKYCPEDRVKKTEPNKKERSLYSIQEGRKCVSFELDLQQCYSEPSIETRHDECSRWKFRRGSTCEELEKSSLYRGHSLYQLRKAIVVKETLQERFLI